MMKKQDVLTKWCIENYEDRPVAVTITIIGLVVIAIVLGISVGTLGFGWLLEHFTPIAIVQTMVGAMAGGAVAVSLLQIRKASDAKKTSEEG